MEFLLYPSVALLAYLLGSVPTGFLVGKARGIDIRKAGSGNIGATNVFRILGKPAGVSVLAADALKGYLACTLVTRLAMQTLASTSAGNELREQLSIVAGVAAVLGHNYTCWLSFKGGKGIATSAGVLASLLTVPFLIILGVWIVFFGLTRYVSLASVAAAFVLPFATWSVGQSRLMVSVAAGMGALAIYKHRSNIQRLLKGTEHRISFKRSSASPESGS
ncbi:MAG: glycerol-3-phosphate 1-O-acyltransferase PlsY [Verrucomicrobia bacterium]|nr:glycerol-3-phosphate 1-O-acyltransferase PlsY [Verrucomicrobiota bacterium]